MWYAEQLREGGARYVRDRSVHVSLVDSVQRDPAAKQQPWDKLLTADGTETRTVDADGLRIPRGQGADPFAKYGRYEHDDYKRYVREAMVCVMAVCLEVHQALEMDAAGWSSDQISEELGCSQTRARGLVDEGLMAVQVFQLIQKPKKAKT
jgi:hypothetical protein